MINIIHFLLTGFFFIIFLISFCIIYWSCKKPHNNILSTPPSPPIRNNSVTPFHTATDIHDIELNMPTLQANEM